MDPKPDADAERLQQMIKRAVVALAEHASTVQIFTTLHDPVTDKTVVVSGGYGNHFAIRGQVGNWLDNLDIPNRVVEDDDDDEDEKNQLN